MRHGKKGYKLGRTRSHRQATLAALSNALIKHKSVRTTLTKAKALRTYVEPLITRSKDDTTHNRRLVFSHLQDKASITELFDEISERVAERRGGYTRVVKLGQRTGDGAEMAVIELVDYNETGEETTGRRRRTRRGSGRGSRRSRKADAATTAPVAAAATEEVSEAVEAAAAVEETGVAETIKDVAEDVVDTLKETAAEVVDTVEEMVEGAVETLEDMVASDEAEAVEAPADEVADAEEEAVEAPAEASVAEEVAEAPAEEETPEQPAEEAEAPEAEAEQPEASAEERGEDEDKKEE